MKAMMKLTKGLFSIHPVWVVWIQILILLNGFIPPLFFPRPEAWAMFGSFIFSSLIMTYLTHRFGFSRILGLAHFVWFPALVYLFGQWAVHPAVDYFGWWLRVVVVIDLLALVLDVWDVYRWVNGERQEIVAGL